MKRNVQLVGMTLVGLGLAGCGGESDCEKLGNLSCERAADCAGDGRARFATGGTGALTFESEADCKTLYVTFGCSGGTDPVVDPSGCIADVEAAVCVSTADGMALDYPSTPACEDLP